MLTVTVFGVKMAARTRMMATVLTTVICVRVETLPEMRVEEKRPTIMRSQYTAAMAPPMAAPLTAMPAPLADASARKKFTWDGMPISMPTYMKIATAPSTKWRKFQALCS